MSLTVEWGIAWFSSAIQSSHLVVAALDKTASTSFSSRSHQSWQPRTPMTARTVVRLCRRQWVASTFLIASARTCRLKAWTGTTRAHSAHTRPSWAIRVKLKCSSLSQPPALCPPLLWLKRNPKSWLWPKCKRTKLNMRTTSLAMLVVMKQASVRALSATATCTTRVIVARETWRTPASRLPSGSSSTV